ncbi:retinal pigment epithelial membrane protein-domain-containing protein [Macrophomina phaseolina]|uniref:Retinal pigment epithelial membrane protein-domain-containing protein n=1 Tax=Macrophomina phaseolina TaxID=35725 RepID=A0ABQ8FR12_9PEZI|nr:retinal pigment epithelial membrane protein-domain-containing protein [Macrophomina phaseolina]
MGSLPVTRAGLKTKWPTVVDLSGSAFPFRLEGEIGDVIVYGDAPPEIDGTFYRMSLGRFVLKKDNGRVDFKIKYVETERYKLERLVHKSFINVIYWANRLLVLEEAANPYEVRAKAFTAHLKVDPFSKELVVFGHYGKKTEELWIKAPWCTMVYDCGITENWLILMLWPFEASIERMKAGGYYWAYTYDRPACFIIVPRRKGPVAGWKEGEYRVYNWHNCMNIHTAGAWEEKDGKVYLEATRVHGNAFPFFPPADGKTQAGEAKGDFVRWELDPSRPSGSRLPHPQVTLELPSEFPRIHERFTSKKYKIVGFCKEPTFIPRNGGAPEGDGWIMSLIEDRRN